MVDGPVRPLPREVVLPRVPAGVPAGGHGHDAVPAVMGLPPGLPLTPATGSPRTTAWRAVWRGSDAPHQPQGAPPAHDPGANFMTAHRHADSLPLGRRPGKSEKK